MSTIRDKHWFKLYTLKEKCDAMFDIINNSPNRTSSAKEIARELELKEETIRVYLKILISTKRIVPMLEGRRYLYKVYNG